MVLNRLNNSYEKLLLPFVLLIPTCATSITTTTAPSAIQVKQTEFIYPHVKRPNLLVADIERSLTIYRDILGFEGAPVSESSLDSYSYPVFNIPRKGRIRYTYLGEPGEDRVFGLTEIKNVDLPRPLDRPYMSTVVIGVTSLADKMEQLAEMGLEMTEPKTTGGTSSPSPKSPSSIRTAI